MAKVRTAANRRTRNRYDEASAGGPAPPTIPVQLTGCEGFWDFTNYSGSGALLNLGTAGSALDMTLNAVTFAAGRGAFNGSSSYGTVANNAALDYIASEDMHIGIIMDWDGATPQSFCALLSKYHSGGYAISTNGATQATYCTWEGSVTGATHADGNNPSIGSSTKIIYWLKRDTVAQNVIAGWTKGSGSNSGTAKTQNPAGTSTNTSSFDVGAQDNHSGFYQRMGVYGIFAKQGIFDTTTDLPAIATYYGVP